ncbi:hypothetical protein HK104_003017 [Borealophlyctis nickersoniae]|nr:hypothetical protein HK104_003017 [Borealophlyctis nickersoniae]
MEDQTDSDWTTEVSDEEYQTDEGEDDEEFEDTMYGLLYGTGAMSSSGDSPSSKRKAEDDDDDTQDESVAARGKRHDRSLVDLLRERELGSGSRGKGKETVHIAKRFMPNQSNDLVDRYASRAYSGQFSEDGTFFYSCTQDFRVHLYDCTDVTQFRRKTVLRAEIGQWTITDCSLSAENRNLIYSSITPIVYLARVNGDLEEYDHIPLDFTEPHHESFGVWSVRFSGDGREIVAGASDHCIYVYDIETRKVLHRIPGHLDDVNAVCFADPTSSHVLFSGSDDDTVKVWDRRSLGRSSLPAGVFVGHTEGITFVASKGDGRYALSNGKDQQMKLWDIRKMMDPGKYTKDRTLRPSYYGQDWDYRFMSYPGSPEFQHPKDCSVQTYRGHSVLKTLIRCHFSPPRNTGQRYVYTGSEDGNVHIFTLEGELVQVLNTGKAIQKNALPGDDDDEEYDEMMGFLLRLRRGNPNWSNRSVTRDVSWHPDLPVIVGVDMLEWGEWEQRGACEA